MALKGGTILSGSMTLSRTLIQGSNEANSETPCRHAPAPHQAPGRRRRYSRKTGFQKLADQLQDGGFAAARGADKRQEIPLGDRLARSAWAPAPRVLPVPVAHRSHPRSALQADRRNGPDGGTLFQCRRHGWPPVPSESRHRNFDRCCAAWLGGMDWISVTCFGHAPATPSHKHAGRVARTGRAPACGPGAPVVARPSKGVTLPRLNAAVRHAR